MQEVVGYLTDLYPFYIHAFNTMHPKDILDITEAIAHVVSVLPVPDILKTLETLCQPIGESLSLKLTMPIPSAGKEEEQYITSIIGIQQFLNIHILFIYSVCRVY
jgi:transportin-3